MEDKKICWVCGSDKFVDDHHYDCKRGKLSPETVPLCRRCHQTYHIWGIGSFSPDTTKKALEVKNKWREILNLPPMKLEDVRHSGYWYKKHGIKPAKIDRKTNSRASMTEIRLPAGQPLCGWEWLNKHLHDLDNWTPRIEITHPTFRLSMNIKNNSQVKELGKRLRALPKA